jgi:hypothetical protein
LRRRRGQGTDAGDLFDKLLQREPHFHVVVIADDAIEALRALLGDAGERDACSPARKIAREVLEVKAQLALQIMRTGTEKLNRDPGEDIAENEHDLIRRSWQCGRFGGAMRAPGAREDRHESVLRAGDGRIGGAGCVALRLQECRLRIERVIVSRRCPAAPFDGPLVGVVWAMFEEVIEESHADTSGLPR